jgi:hypothetical protein
MTFYELVKHTFFRQKPVVRYCWGIAGLAIEDSFPRRCPSLMCRVLSFLPANGVVSPPGKVFRVPAVYLQLAIWAFLAYWA